jgi:hypothetical protein
LNISLSCHFWSCLRHLKVSIIWDECSPIFMLSFTDIVSPEHILIVRGLTHTGL